MNQLGIGVKMRRQSPKLDRKELATVRAVLPNWLRGQDLKIAQQGLKFITAINKDAVVNKSTSQRVFHFTFDSLQETEVVSHDVSISYVVNEGDLVDETTGVCVKYERPVVNAVQRQKYVEDVVSVIPVLGLAAYVKDALRIDHSLGDHLAANAIKVSTLVEALTILLESLDGHCSVTEFNGELDIGRVFSFKLMAKNNHGREFAFSVAL